MPFAPGLLSTTKGWRVLSSMYLPTRRAVMSPDPPGAKGTMIWTALLVQVSALAWFAAARAGRTKRARRDSGRRNEDMPCSLGKTRLMDSAGVAALPCSHGTIRSSTAQRHSCCRFFPCDRRADVHPDLVRHGRRGDQDRES